MTKHLSEKRRFSSAAIPWGALLLALVGIAGCAVSPKKGPAPGVLYKSGENARVDAVYEAFLKETTASGTAKGLGRMRIHRPDTAPYTARMAWATRRPDRLRVEIMDPAGRPVVTLAGQNSHLAVFSHPDGKFYESEGSRADLKRWMPVAVTLEDLVTLFSSGVPVAVHQYRQVKEAPPLVVLSLYDDARRLVERIHYHEADARVTRFEMWARREKFLYGCDLGKERVPADAAMTRHLELSDGAGSALSIQIDRFWPDPTVSEDLFHLASPP